MHWLFEVLLRLTLCQSMQYATYAIKAIYIYISLSANNYRYLQLFADISVEECKISVFNFRYHNSFTDISNAITDIGSCVEYGISNCITDVCYRYLRLNTDICNLFVDICK